MVKAMEYIARQLNDEEILEAWFIDGVADGDIDYGDLSIKDEDLDQFGVFYYTDDKTFADLMHTFLRLMKAAVKSGGLYCDGIVDKKGE